MAEPKIRFKKDDGTDYPEWLEYDVSYAFDKIKQKNKDGRNNNVITNSAEFGLIPQRDFFDKDIAVEGNTGNYTIIQKGDFVYNPRKSQYAPMGPFNCYGYEEEGIVSPLYTCLRPKHTIDTEYLLWYFKTDKWYQFVSDNGAVYEKLYSLTNNNLHSLQGKNNKEFSSAFVDALFLYESYRIPEDIAYLLSGFSINAFHYKAMQFETCNRNIFIEYSFDDSSPVQPYCYGDLQQEWFQRHRINNISLLPKRYGNVPDNFELLRNAVSQYINIHGHNDIQIFLRDTCVDFGIPFMTYIDYCRYCAKADIGSKKEIYQLYKDYYDMNLIAAFNQYKNDVDSYFSSSKDRREQYANFIYTE